MLTLVSVGILDNGNIRVGLQSNAIQVLQLVRAIHQRSVFEDTVFCRGTLGIRIGEEYFDFTNGNDFATMMTELNVMVS